MSRPRQLLVALVAVLVSSVAACGGGGGGNSNAPTGPSTPTNSGGSSGGGGTTQVPANTVIATSSSIFNPAALTVTKGTTVTFTFEVVTHNVVFSTAGSPDNIPNTASTSVARQFPNAGVFNYSCTLHPGMNGTITVN